MLSIKYIDHGLKNTCRNYCSLYTAWTRALKTCIVLMLRTVHEPWFFYIFIITILFMNPGVSTYLLSPYRSWTLVLSAACCPVQEPRCTVWILAPGPLLCRIGSPLQLTRLLVIRSSKINRILICQTPLFLGNINCRDKSLFCALFSVFEPTTLCLALFRFYNAMNPRPTSLSLN